MTLVAHYPLQEDSGDAHDASGNGNTGTVTGATQGVTGILGATAYSFDGTDDYVDTGANQGITGEITVAAWCKFGTLPTSGGFDGVLSAGYDGTNTGWELRINGSALSYSSAVEVGSYDGSHHKAGFNQSDIATGTWYHIVGVWDSSTWYIYRDGTDATGDRVNPGTGAVSSSADRYFGAHDDNGSPGYYTDVDIANVRVYDHALTPSEVQYLYDRVTMPTYSTGVKTYGSTITPDLEVPTFTLNGESCEITVVGSPGTASEEKQSASLTGGTTSYTLSWGSSHTDFRLDVTAGPLSNVENRVSISEANLVI